MAKFQSPLLGYNNNVRHKNRVFHIQTEDSGVKHPHIITHLFMDGGRILKSVKRSYAEHVGAEGMSETVRLMMKEQHKAMFIALRDGQFDHLVDPPAADKPANGTAPAKPAPAVSAPAAASASARGEAAAAPAASPAPPNVAAPTPAPAPTLAAAGAAAKPTPPPPAGELTLDLDALGRAAQEPASAGGFFQSSDLPPPPKSLFSKEPGTGTYRTREATPERARPASAPPSAPRGSTPRSSSEGRYAPARPAAIFGSNTRPPPQSIFSDELISDKSLDEVILSYLAEDLEPPQSK